MVLLQFPYSMEIAMSPTYFVTVTILSVIWQNNALFLLAMYAILPEYYVTFLFHQIIWPNHQNIMSHFCITKYFALVTMCASSLCPYDISRKSFAISPK